MVIPIRDENPTRSRPVVTLALIAINLIVYFGVQMPKESEPSSVFRGGSAYEDVIYEYAAIPCELREGEPLDAAQYVTDRCDAVLPDVPGSERAIFPDKSVWLAVLFSMFMHGSILHVLGNMLFLWIFGNNIEDRLGKIGYLGFYVLGGVVAAAAHVAFNLDSVVPVVGASGAIAAVMGAYIVWYPHARVLSLVPLFLIFTFVDLPAIVVLGLWFLLQFLTNPNEGVAWLAHVGGFVFGAVVALGLRPLLGAAPTGASRRRPRRTYRWPDDDDWDGGFRGRERGGF
jgi:membrane associated rhomboid family serine protease